MKAIDHWLDFFNQNALNCPVFNLQSWNQPKISTIAGDDGCVKGKGDSSNPHIFCKRFLRKFGFSVNSSRSSNQPFYLALKP
jgi:hypothetical protein